MSVLARVNFFAQQRVDLPDFLATDSYNAADLRALVSNFTGTQKPFVARGFRVVGKSGLTVSLQVADSLAFNVLDGIGSFYQGLSDDDAISLQLPGNQSNLFIEATFKTETRAETSKGTWDPLNLSGDSDAGNEFSSGVDSQEVTVLEILVNTTGFSDGAIKLFWASTGASTITSMEDRRDLLYRLGTGDDPLNKYEFSTSRGESVPAGTGVDNATDSPWRERDSSGAINDKGLGSFKEWADAVMTRVSEISGSPLWYNSGGSTAPVTGLSVNELYFDTIGHSVLPSAQSSFKWMKVSGTLRLTGGAVTGTTNATAANLITWKSNNSSLQWSLGASFTSASDRTYTDVRFVSDEPIDGGNVYLVLEREVSKGSGNAVSWGDAGSSSFSASRSVSGLAGDFTGIAIGDYVRKESEGYANYYKVTRYYNGSTISTANAVADSTVTALELQSVLSSAAPTVAVSTESLKYFRTHYSNDDIYVDSATDTFAALDASYYWLGHRNGDLFYLRNYGTMQEGEEVTTVDTTYAQGRHSGSDLIFEHSDNAAYTTGSGYTLKTGSGTLLTIRRYKRDNTVETPTPGSDNSGAMLDYTIAAPVGLMSVGDTLWVRLSDTTGGSLTGNPVTNNTDDVNNTDTLSNRWEIRSAANTPARTFDNKDVYWVAKRVAINGSPALIFADGSVLNDFGNFITNSLHVRSELKIGTKPVTGVLFVDPTTAGLVNEDTANFFYNKNTSTFGLFNFRITNNNIDVLSPANVSLLSSLGSNTLSIGSANSTTYIPGDLIVDGTTISANVSYLTSDDKLVTLGAGNLLNAGFGSGIEVADDTHTATLAASTSGQIYVNLTLSSTAWLTTGSVIGVSATADVGGITAGQISSQYTVVASGSTAGDAQIISGTILRIWTNGTATSTTSSSTTPPRVWLSPWSIRVGAADGTYTSGITSWAFRVKSVATAPTLTPVASYGIVPTAHSTNMLANRIPFVNDDNSGPAGVDSTLNFNSGFTWDNSLNKLTTQSLKTTGGFEVTRTTNKTATYTLTTSDITVPFDTTSAVADVLANLPAATGSGRVYIIKDAGGVSNQTNKKIIITPNGVDTIDDDINYTINTPYGSAIIEDTASGKWSVVAKSAPAGSGSVTADLYNPISTTLPSGASATVDGISVVNGYHVLFTNLSSGNNRIYEVSGVGTSIAWTAVSDFLNSSETPIAGESVRIRRGTSYNGQIVYFTKDSTWLINDTLRFFDGNLGTNYWELSSIKTSTLTNNTVNGEVFSVTVSGSENFIVSYSIVRGAGVKETGELFITSDGTSASLTTSNAYLGTSGVTFDAAVVTGNLKLYYTTTNTGTAGTMKFFTKRWSDSAGGPAGLPSYSGGGGSTPAAGSISDVQYKGSDGNLAGDDNFQWDSTNGAIGLNGLLISKLNGPSTLLDNQASAVTIFTYAQANKWNIIEYSLERNGDTEVGRLLITNNGTIASISNDSIATIVSLGVTFSADLSGGNVRVRYTTTNTGFSATFKYSSRYWQ